MRRAVYSLLLLALTLAATGAALPEPPDSDPVTRDEPLAWNQSLLDTWKQNPNHYARLKRDLNHFWSLPREERDRLRALDKELHDQDPATQNRLWNVLERYHDWLERLQESDRKRIESATGSRRVSLIKEIRQQQWVGRLPERTRNELKAMSAEKRSERIAKLKEEERERVEEALKTQPTSKPKKDKPVKLSEFPVEVQLFVRDGLYPLLNSLERDRLKYAEKQPWPVFARTLQALAAKHPIPLPGPIGPVRLSDLPASLGKKLKDTARVNAVRREEGKWPEFLVALQKLKQYHQHPLPARLTPSAPTDFSEAIREFLPVLGKELSKEEQERLNSAQGKWPEYPKVLLELARKHKLDVPGMTLPGPREFWDNVRAALPEVPDRELFHFALTELTVEEREKLPLSSGDPNVREEVKKKYFKRHPRELRRLQQLDSRGVTLSNSPEK